MPAEVNRNHSSMEMVESFNGTVLDAFTLVRPEGTAHDPGAALDLMDSVVGTSFSQTQDVHPWMDCLTLLYPRTFWSHLPEALATMGPGTPIFEGLNGPSKPIPRSFMAHIMNSILDFMEPIHPNATAIADARTAYNLTSRFTAQEIYDSVQYVAAPWRGRLMEEAMLDLQ